jgi:hypothetical protein
VLIPEPKLRDVDLQEVARARLLSRRFDAIATPIFYRVLCLNERVIATDAESRYPGVLDHISAYTSHVVASSDLDPDGIGRVIGRIQKLSSVR